MQYLRGLAALAVVLCHYGSSMKNYPQLSAIFSAGQVGVQVFFMISGFVILLSMLQNKYSVKQFFRFLLRRSVRIDPPYLLVILLTLLCFGLLAQLPSFHGRAIPFIPGQFIAHVLYVVPFTRWHFYNAIFWTLSVEFQFYVLTGCLFFLSPTIVYRSVFLVVFSLLTFIPFQGSYYLVTTYSPVFALGMALVLYYRDRKPSLLIVPVICFAIAFYQFGTLVAACLLIASLAILYFKKRLPALLYLGEISYSLYLIHPLALILFLGVLKRVWPLPAINELFLLTAATVVALLAATVLYYLAERPAITYSKKIRLQGNKESG